PTALAPSPRPRATRLLRPCRVLGEGGGEEVVEPLDELGEGGSVVEHPFGVASMVEESQVPWFAGVVIQGLCLDGLVELVLRAVHDQQGPWRDLVDDLLGGEPEQEVCGFEGDAAAEVGGLVQF